MVQRLVHAHRGRDGGHHGTREESNAEGGIERYELAGDLAGSDFAGVVSLEVDLRKQSQDRDALCSLLMSMREGIEATLASG